MKQKSVPQPRLILASSSPYRRQQLAERLALPLCAISPDIDEAPLAGETPRATALRLSRDKARAVLGKADAGDIVIAGDQTAEWQGELLSKPGSPEKTIQQLRAFSGHTLQFFSGLCVIQAGIEEPRTAVVETEVKFRVLSEEEIARYVERDQPWDCVGAFKNEGLGIALFEWIRSDDPSALTGLPLIQLCERLRKLGVAIL